MSLMRQWEWNRNNQRRDRRRNRTREREQLQLHLPARTQAWQQRGLSIQAFVVKSWIGRINTFYRLGTIGMLRGEPEFRPYFTGGGSSDLLEMLEKVEKWHGLGCPFDASNKIPARRWSRACEAVRPFTAVDRLSTKKIDRVACHRFEMYSNFGSHRHIYQLVVPKEEHHHSLECEHFFSLFDFMAVRDLLLDIKDEHRGNTKRRDKPVLS